MPHTNTTRRSQLRDRTSHAHAELDSMVGPLGSLQDYRRYLAGIAAFRLALEPLLERSDYLPAGGWRPTRIAAALRADLADLEMSDMIAPAMAIRIGSRHEFLGCAYVIEGSALGARVLYRRACELGLGSGNGARHLALQSATLDNWRAFTSLLEATEPFDASAAARAASATFGAAVAAFSAAQSAFLKLADV